MPLLGPSTVPSSATNCRRAALSCPAPQRHYNSPSGTKQDIHRLSGFFATTSPLSSRYGAYLWLGSTPQQRQPQRWPVAPASGYTAHSFGRRMNGSFQLPGRSLHCSRSGHSAHGRHQGQSPLRSLWEKGPKFNISVAADAGVRRAPAQVNSPQKGLPPPAGTGLYNSAHSAECPAATGT